MTTDNERAFEQSMTQYSTTMSQIIDKAHWFLASGVSMCGILDDSTSRVAETLEKLAYLDDELIRKDIVVKELRDLHDTLSTVAANANATINAEAGNFNSLLAKIDRIIFEMQKQAKEADNEAHARDS